MGRPEQMYVAIQISRGCRHVSTSIAFTPPDAFPGMGTLPWFELHRSGGESVC